MRTQNQTPFLRRKVVTALLLAPAAGCSEAYQLRALAAEDLACKGDAVTFREIPLPDDRPFDFEPHDAGGWHKFRASGCHQTANYVCRPNDVNGMSCGREFPRSPHDGAFPEGAAGLVFGSSSQDAGARCTGAGQVWTAGDHGDFTCNHPPASVGFEGSLRARFCAGMLCGIEILASNPGENGWAKQFLHVRDELANRYGDPTSAESVVPDECRAALARCLSEGKAAGKVSWLWSTRSTITLSLGRFEGAVAMRLSYERTGPAL